MNMDDLRSIIHHFRTRPAVVMGGGPSLPADLQLAPAGAMLISVNHHALRLCKPEILVFMDKPGDNPELADAIHSFKGIKICPDPTYSDVDLNAGELWWDGGFTASLATWIALKLKCDPVLLAGMDCYQGKKKYFYEREYYHPCHDFPLEYHLAAWRPAFSFCPHPDRIKAIGGPLVEIFGQYLPGEYRLNRKFFPIGPEK